MHYVYILKCRDGSLYTGYTNDLARRVRAHNEGKSGAKYTRSRRPVALEYSERFKTPGKALSREAAIKRLTRGQKLALLGKGSTK